MVPYLHKCNIYIKRKLRVWTAQQCNFIVSAKPAPTGTGHKLPGILQRRIGQATEIFKTLGLLFAMIPGLLQCKVYVKRKLRVWRAQKCNFLVSSKTAPTGTGQHTIPCLAALYLVSNRNFQNFGATYRHGTVLAQMQYLY